MLSKRFRSLLTLLLVIIFITIIVEYIKILNDTDDKWRKSLIVNNYDEELVLRSNVLVNLTNFEYRIESSVCDAFDSNEEILGIIIVTSYIGHDELRSAHRQAMSQANLMKMGLARIFLLSDIPQHEKFITQKSIVHENKIFGDIVQGNFIENYRNLTYKHVMGLKWSVEKCPQAKFIIKIDDDIVYDIYFLQNYLVDVEMENQNKLLAGFILKGSKVIRNQANKWYVTKDEYEDDVYPDYLSGWLYITTQSAARSLVHASEYSKYFWIDDTFVTGVLAKRENIEFTRLNHWYSANSEFLECCIQDAIKSNLNCDYHVGPNGGENKMIIRFTKAMEQCQDDFCGDRQPENSLKATCIGQVKEIVKDHGEAFLKPIRL